MTAFMIDHENTIWELPRTGFAYSDSQAAFVLRGKLITGSPLTLPVDPNQVLTYTFPGDPFTGEGWIDPGAPYDTRELLASGPFKFASGQTVRFVVAFVVAQDTDRFSSVEKLKASVPAIVSRWQTIAGVNSSHQVNAIPVSDHLFPAYPNPFNPSTNISFTLRALSFTTLSIFDVLGRKVATLVSENLPPGEYTRQWNANSLPSGIYFYRFISGNYSLTRKMMLLK